jgi:hypothetical protein
MNKKILRTKEAEIAKAGRLVFDAIFGDSDEFEQTLEDEIDREASGDNAAITVEGHSFVRCAACGREQVVPPNIDARVLEQHGWRLDAGAWRCSFCVGR